MLSRRQLLLVLVVGVIVAAIGFIVFSFSGISGRGGSGAVSVKTLGNGVIRLKSFDVTDLLKIFNHSKIVFSQTYSNGTSDVSYVIIDRVGLDEINGTPVYLVKIEAISSNNKSVALLWMTENFSKTILFRAGGLEYTGETADYYGKLVLSAPSLILSVMQMNILFDINVSDGMVKATTLYWSITSFNESSIKIKNETYTLIAGRAVKENGSEVQREVWFKAVDIGGEWYLLYVKVVKQDETYTISIEELS